MTQWTDSARAAVDNYLAQARRAAQLAGGDPNEVADDLKRHIDEEVSALRLPVVNEEDIRRILARLGAPEAANAAPEPTAPPLVPASAATAGASKRSGCLNLALNAGFLIFGVILPLIAIGFEFCTGMCAAIFFDPLPTLGHVLLVALVPVANLLVWLAVRGHHWRHRTKLGWANGAAIAVALFYGLLFLPLTPFALIGVVFGLGVLPLAPLLALVTTVLLRRRLRRMDGGTRPLPGLWRGMALSLAALAVCTLPMVLTEAGMQMAASDVAAESNRGVRLLRAWGEEEQMLRVCYGRGRSETDWYSWGKQINAETARAIYYRVTGVAFNAVPPPKLYAGRGRWNLMEEEFTWDNDQGGDAVAGRVKGLSLVSSRQDGSVDADAALAYLEWTLEFKNDSQLQREARAQIALPPGGVVSRLTLWVDGEEREAAFSGRSQVKAACKEVVSQRRDPVLVTTCGPDRVLVQCFPVLPNGGRMKVRVGVTAPLLLATTETGSLRWPHFAERNFTIREEFRHSLWLESAQPLETAGKLVADQAKSGGHAVRGEVSDGELNAPELSVRARRNSAAGPVWTHDTRSGSGGIVRQTSMEKTAVAPDRLVVVVDGTRTMRAYGSAIAGALSKLPEGLEVRLLLAADGFEELSGPTGQSNGTTRSQAANALRQAKFIGGHDNVPALIRAWDLAAEKDAGVIVWIHGPQPILLDNAEGLRQRFERRPNHPVLWEIQTSPGPDRVAEKLDGLEAVQAAPRAGKLEDDLDRLLAGLTGRRQQIELIRQRTDAGTPTTAGDGKETSMHLARLWAAEEVQRLRAAGKSTDAMQLAARYQLVTPVSGAVVLETQAQYQRAGLSPVDPATVPTVPEPATWALLAVFVLVVALARKLRRRNA